MARGSPREVKGRGKEKGGVGAVLCGKPRLIYPEREVGNSGGERRAGGVLFASRGRRSRRKAWGGAAALWRVLVLAWRLGSLLCTYSPVPREDRLRRTLGGLGGECICSWPWRQGRGRM